MMRVEDEGKVAEVAGAAAMNEGLMKVAGTDDATIAGAAIMSLTFGPSGPVAISAGDVRVARQGGGWYLPGHSRSAGPQAAGDVRDLRRRRPLHRHRPSLDRPLKIEN